jgi:ketosteroid isomerase-like protein
VVGRAAIESWAADFFARYRLRAELTGSSGVQVSGDLAYHLFQARGYYVPTAGADSVPFDQKYLDVWHRQPDSTWHLLYHMWSGNSSDRSVWR